MSWQLFDMELLRCEGVGFEICFYRVIDPVKEDLRENTDGDDLWISAWTTE
jgi:hypothetical protein